MLSRAVSLLGIVLFAAGAAGAGEVIPLYSGVAPGSEEWTHTEQEYYSPIFRTEVVTNVVRPTLTYYAPTTTEGNGTSVIVCPGGGFHVLSINSEGVDVAKWLNGQGIAAFVLKYRLFPTGEDGVKELLQKSSKPEQVQQDMATVIPMAVSDGAAAVRYVREHASDLGVEPNRIGIMGFSAGGTIAATLGMKYSPTTRPDFIAPIYAYLEGLDDAQVPKDAPPLFLTAASDDQIGLALPSVDLYRKWLEASKPAELHLYAKGGHGFGMRKQNLPTDRWIERFGEWLVVQKLVPDGD